MAANGIFTSLTTTAEATAPSSTQMPAPGLHCTCAACAEGLAQALVQGVKWTSENAAQPQAATVITYSFYAQGGSVLDDSYNSMGYAVSAHGFSDTDKEMTRAMLAKIAAVCNIQFVEVADNAAGSGVLRYAYSDQPSAMGFAGYTFYPSESTVAGDVWLASRMAGTEWDGYRPSLLLHETLHALGLKHPFEGADTLGSQDNIIPNTVMSYSPMEGVNSGSLSRYPAEPMSLDVAALQALYGAASDNVGNTRYDLSTGEFQGNFRTIWDSAGVDTLDASAVSNAVQLDLNAGAKSNVGLTVFAFGYSGGRPSATATYDHTLSIAEGAVIENATGSAYDDVIKGNAANNVLKGGDGNDRLEGAGGNDTLEGGNGVDTAVFAQARSTVRIAHTGDHYVVGGGAAGTDTLRGIERMSFTDAQVALDLDGNAGTAALLLGAVAGPSAVHNKVAVGKLLAMLDGGASALDAADALCAALVGQPLSSQSFVGIVYNNLTGHAPTAAEASYYTHLLDTGAATQASLAVLAAQTDMNVRNVDLIGLANTGLDYVLPAA